ncbi:MAG: haloacid dehalogenase-like hydrolase [Planctomycetales bacterium]|nr:haloacid dehalogenase-like hydrolase [Planctomycetales bacterium]
MYAVLFDIDGTLISTCGAGRAAMAAGFERVFGVRDDKPIETSGRTDRSIGGDLLTAHGLSDSEDNWQRLRAGYLAHLPAQLARCGGRVLPGVSEMLDVLAGRADVCVGLLTGNTEASARIKLEHYGMWERFTLGAYGDAHRDRDMVAADAWQCVTQRHADIRPERVLVLGDTPHDVRCARHIGARAIAVATGLFSHESLAQTLPDVLLADLSDAASVLELLAV